MASEHARTAHRLIDPLIVVVGAILLVVDQLTKQWIVAAIGPGSPTHQIEVLGDWVRLSYVTNTGAAFGLFQGKTPILSVISFLAIPALLFSNRLLSGVPLLARLSLGLLLGGAAGNLVDRVRLGYVVDFVDVGVGDIRFWAFNVADSSFVVGVIVLAIYLFLMADSAPEPDRATAAR